MPRPVDNARPGTSVNVLKKVRTSGGWRLCPVVREANGRLRDRVRISGRTEIHPEGVYYLEWRQDGRRLREAIPNSAEVPERARLKSLELEARKAGAELDLVRAEEPHRTSLLSNCAENGAAVMATPRNTTAERLLLSGIEAYIKERVDAVLRSRLSTVSVPDEGSCALPSLPEPKMLAAPVGEESQEQDHCEAAPSPATPNGSNSRSTSEMTVAEAIDSYLKDVEPPQREFKTYEEYRNVLYRFRDPEIRTTNSGTPVANLSLATTDRYKDSQGEWQDRTEWHNLATYARGAEILRDYVKKGSKLYVEGKLTTRSWDDKDSGKKMYRTEIVVNDISLLSGNDPTKSAGNGNGVDADQKKRSTQSKGRQAPSGNTESGPDYDYGGLGITDQDVPF